MPVSSATKQAVFLRDDGKCQLFHQRPVEGTEISHYKHQGMGGDPADAEVNQVNNLYVTCAECHRLLHAGTFTVTKFDPLRWVFEVVGRDGQKVSGRALWFFCKQDWREAQETIKWLSESVSALKGLQWKLAEELHSLKSKRLYEAAGYSDIYELSHELGISSPQAKAMMRAWVFIETHERRDELRELGVEVVNALRKVPANEFDEMLEVFHQNPPPVAWKAYEEKYSREKLRTFRKFRAEGGRVVYEETKGLSEDDINIEPSELVLRGGTIVSGGIVHDVEDRE